MLRRLNNRSIIERNDQAIFRFIEIAGTNDPNSRADDPAHGTDGIRLIFVFTNQRRAGLDGWSEGMGGWGGIGGWGRWGKTSGKGRWEGRAGGALLPYPPLPPYLPCYPPKGLTKNRINEMSST
jgi:hypothetical protein